MAIELDHARVGGGYLNAGSGAVTGRFESFFVVTDTVLASITHNSSHATYTGSSIVVGETLAAGQYHPFPFTAVQVTSGVIGYIGVMG